MALRPSPKRNPIEYQKVDELQKEIFGASAGEFAPELSQSDIANDKPLTQTKSMPAKTGREKRHSQEAVEKPVHPAKTTDQLKNKQVEAAIIEQNKIPTETPADGQMVNANLSDLETIAAGIISSKAGQGRHTTRPFSLPRTLIIDTTRLKSKFRTIDEQFTQNVIIDFLLREALAVVTPENYRAARATAFEDIKRPNETTRRSLTVTEDVVYQMSELKAGINLETGKKYSNDEIFSTLLALGVSWLYRSSVLS